MASFNKFCKTYQLTNQSYNLPNLKSEMFNESLVFDLIMLSRKERTIFCVETPMSMVSPYVLTNFILEMKFKWQSMAIAQCMLNVCRVMSSWSVFKLKEHESI